MSTLVICLVIIAAGLLALAAIEIGQRYVTLHTEQQKQWRSGESMMRALDYEMTPAGQVSLDGMDLENSVRSALGLSADWELHDVETVLDALTSVGLTFFASCLDTEESRWEWRVTRRLPEGDQTVREFGASRATALGRAALVAAREWGMPPV